MKPGLAFGEHIKTEKIKRRKYDDDPKPRLRMRGFLLPVVLGFAVLLLVGKLFSLQLIHGNEYRVLADSNRMRAQIIPAPRGIIFDRRGTPLVFNIPGFRQTIKDPSEKKPDKIVHLEKEKALQLIAKGDRTVSVDSLREYPYKDSTVHVLGYLGQITKEELDSDKFVGYQSTDWVGKNGIEWYYEHLLRGRDGNQLIEVDAMGKPVRALGQTDPIPGQDITVTLDVKLQNAITRATKDVKKGVVIVSRPNGEILSLVSRPSFDPNLFTLDETYEAASTSGYQKIEDILLDNDNQPLLNRAIGGIYPPGSTFKLVTAVSGLENNVIDEKYAVTDTGILRVGEFSYANWFYTDYGKTEPGKVDVIKGISRSNDIFFYKLAEKVGVARLSETGKKFGLGEPLGIDLGGEVGGLLPTKQWKEKEIGEKWYLGDDFHYGIGQGYLLTTPLQVNSWTETIANGGTLYEPRLFLHKESVVKQHGLVSQKTVALLREGMIQSCSPGGVAFPLFDFTVKNKDLKIDGKNIMQAASKSAEFRRISVACKTGTAQHGGEKTLPHSWITLFAPAYKPEVVVTVLVDSGGEGSKVAAPIAKKVLDAYFGK